MSPSNNDNELTISNKVILHLFDYLDQYDNYFVPFALVQGGIADAVDTYRSDISRTLKKLKTMGFVEERICNVEGVKRKRKAYFLTESGRSRAEKLNEMLATMKITLKLPNGKKEVELGEVSEHIGRKLSISQILSNLNDNTLDVDTLVKEDEIQLTASAVGSVMVGRDEELKILNSFHSDLNKGKGRALIIYGEAGIGKTRLVNEFKVLCLDVFFLEGNCLYQTGADPYLPFIDILNTYFQDARAKTTKEKMDSRIGGLGFASLVLDQESSEFISKPEFERNRIFEYIINTFLAISKEKPIIVFIDDLHWADAGTIHLFHYLTRNLRHNPVMIIGCYRPEEIGLDSGHPLHEVLMRMRKENLMTELHLERLNLKETSEMVTSYLRREDVPQRFVQMVYRETDGNPFFIEEILNSLSEENAIQYSKGEWSFPPKIKIPSSVRETLRRRINKLSIYDKNTLDVAAVIGEKFDLEVLLEVLGNEETLLDSVDNLRKANLIEEDVVGKDLYRFHHDKIMEVVYNDLSKARQKLLHKKIGETLEEISKDNLAEVITKLAYHYSRTNDFQKSYDYCIKAAQKAEKLYSYEEAITFYENALDAIDSMQELNDATTDESTFAEAQRKTDDMFDKDFFEEVLDRNVYLKNRKADILLKLGDAYDILAQCEKSRRRYEEAFTLTESARKRALIYSKIGNVMRRLGFYNEGIKHCEKALEWLKKYDGVEKALTYNSMSLLYFIKGDLEKALDYCEDGLEVMENLSDEKVVGDLLNTLGILHHHKGNYKKSIKAFNESVELREKIGDPRGLAANFNNIGNHYLAMGDYNKALESYKKSSEFFEKIGDIRGLGRVCNNIGLIYMKKRDFKKALDYYQKSLVTAEKIGEPLVISSSAINIAELYTLKKEFVEALEYYKKSMDLCKKTGCEFELLNTYIGIADVYLQKKDYRDALVYISQALSLSKKSNMNDLLASALKLAAIIQREKGQLSISKENFEKAIELFQEFGNELELGKTFYEYSLLLKKRNEHGKASQYIGDAVALLEKFKDDYNAEQICKKVKKPSTRKK